MNVAGLLKAKGSEVATTRTETSALEAARELKRRRIGAMVVVDDEGAVVGIVSERDVVHALVDRGGDLSRVKVGDVMTQEVASCTPSTSLNEVMQRMTEGRFRHLPVIEDGKLCGIVSIGDAVKHRIDELQREGELLRSYIASG